MSELPHPWRRKSDLEARPRRLRKGMYLLPSLFTAANIAAGYYALLQTLQGTIDSAWHFDHAAIAIGFAVLFDGLDGRIARMTNTVSDFGRELDSLADAITFGVAPAVLCWMWGFHLLPLASSEGVSFWLALHSADAHSKLVQLGIIASFIFLVAGASRLARFNIQKNPQPSNPGRPGKKYFVGMPIPAGAGVVAAVVHFTSGEPLTLWGISIAWGALVLALSFLMVCTWRFPSFKDFDLRHRHPFWLVIVLCGIIAAIWFYSEVVLFALALAYMLSGVVLRLSWLFRHRPSSPPPLPQTQE